jgi:hypothetical protein
MRRDFVADVIVSGVLPWLCVFALQRAGVGLLLAIAVATIFPVVRGIISLVRKHRLDAIGTVSITFLLASIGVTFLTGDIHFTLLRGVVGTGAFSLVCIGSLAAPRPLMFYLGRQTVTRGDPEAEAAWNARWEFAPFRRAMRIITLVWGVAFALEVATRVVVAYSLAPMVTLGLSPVITYGTLAALFAWTFAYGNAARRRYETVRIATSSAGEPAPNTAS